jgi:hypothetical protein
VLCEALIPSEAISYPCTEYCILPETGEKCSTSCINPNHYKIEEGRCILKECEDREIGEISSSSSTPTSSSCSEDNDNCIIPEIGDKCSISCINPNHYKIEEGRCILKECNVRPPGEVYSYFPCGNDCVLNETNGCEGFCEDNNFYENISGICELKSCDNRISKENINNPCGEDCVLQETNECGESCLDTYFYESYHLMGDSVTGMGVCVLKDCNDRVSKGVVSDNPCGIGCVLQESVEGICAVECKNPSHFKENSSSGICELLICEDRADDGSSRPCYDSEDEQDENFVLCVFYNSDCYSSCPEGSVLKDENKYVYVFLFFCFSFSKLDVYIDICIFFFFFF